MSLWIQLVFPLIRFSVDRFADYRVNLRKIVDQLNGLGHHLEGFEQFSLNINDIKIYCLYDREQGHWIGPDMSITDNQNIHLENDNLIVNEVKADFSIGEMSAAIPEITTKNTNQKILRNNYINELIS